MLHTVFPLYSDFKRSVVIPNKPSDCLNHTCRQTGLLATVYTGLGAVGCVVVLRTSVVAGRGTRVHQISFLHKKVELADWVTAAALVLEGTRQHGAIHSASHGHCLCSLHLVLIGV